MDFELDGFYHQIFDNALLAIAVTDLEGKLIHVNNTWLSLLGYHRNELPTLHIKDVIPEAYYTDSSDDFQALIHGTLPHYHRIMEYKRKDGATFWTNLYVSALLDKEGKIAYILRIYVDIDKQVQAEIHMKQTHNILETLNNKLTRANRDLAAKNVELKHAYKRMEELARTDIMTGVFNRRELEHLLQIETRRSQRNKRCFTLCIGDIDNFKHFNDTYGHDVGDMVLRDAARIMNSNIRSTDFLGRWGGEEFLFILPETDCEGALIVIDRIRQQIQNHELVTRHYHLKITMTFGFSTYYPGKTCDNVLKEADIALYAGKHRGKNVSLCFDESMIQEVAN